MKNKDIIEAVISLLTMDGELSRQKRRFLSDVCKRLKIPKKYRDESLEKAKQGKGRVRLPESEADKNHLMYLLVQAVVADGDVTPEERMILEDLVEMLGISKAKMETFIQARLKEVRTEKPLQPSTTCPKCGNEQTNPYKCQRCGIIFEKYKKNKSSTSDDAERLMDLLSSSNEIEGETS